MAVNITAVTGPLTHDGAGTVSGSGFSAKAVAAPRVWDPCNHGGVIADRWDGAWPKLTPAFALDYRVAQRSIPMPHTRTTKYLAGCHNPGGDAEDGNNVMIWKNCTFAEGRRSFMSWYGRLDDGWTFDLGSPADNNLKHWDYSHGSEPYTQIDPTHSNWYTQWFADVGGNAGCFNTSYVNVPNINDDGASISGGVAYGQHNYVNPFAGAWVKHEIALIYASGASGLVSFAENGTNKLFYSGPTDGMADTARTEAIGGYARGQGADTQWRYFCDLYVDDCFNAVMLGNAATKGGCTVIEYQIPTAWADGSITFTANLGAFGDSDIAWVYVRDSNGTVNNDGYAVTLGSAPTPPPAPTPSPHRGRGRRNFPVNIRFKVELGEAVHYFSTEQEARAFMAKQAQLIYKRARVVARSKIVLPQRERQRMLPRPQPLPRFVTEGNDALATLTARINARIEAILANPQRDADEDDADLADLMADADETTDDADIKRILQ